MAIEIKSNVMALSSEMEETLPREVLQALTTDVPHALLEELVCCATDDLVRERVVAKRAHGASAADNAQLVRSWGGHDLAVLYKVFGAVCALLVQFARENPQSPAAQQQVLLELGVDDPAFVAVFLPLVVAATPPIRAVLEHTSFDFANVVDVSWRLDYVLESSSAGSVHEPLYFVELQVQTPSGAIEPLAFTCSVEDLRDLVYRLQEATNEVEKLVSGAASSSLVSAADTVAPVES